MSDFQDADIFVNERHVPRAGVNAFTDIEAYSRMFVILVVQLEMCLEWVVRGCYKGVPPRFLNCEYVVVEYSAILEQTGQNYVSGFPDIVL